MKKAYYNFPAILFLSFLFIIDCQKEEITSRDFPRVNTLEVTKISDDGATFNAEITFKGNAIIEEYGFVWDTIEEPSFEYAEKAVIQENASTGKFSLVIKTTLKKGKDYFVKAFIHSDRYMVYGKQVSFHSMGSSAPFIKDFSPLTGKILDSVTIYGNGFSLGQSNSVKFDTLVARVLRSTGTTLTVLVPERLQKDSSIISVSIFGNTARAKQLFALQKTSLTDYYPKTGTFGDTIIITGKNLPCNHDYFKVNFNNSIAEIIEAKDDLIKCVVPSDIQSPDPVVSLNLGTFKLSFQEKFSLLPPVISSFSPAKAENTGITVTITGVNFSHIPSCNAVFFKDKRAEVLNASRNELTILIPGDLIGLPEVSVIDSFRIIVEVAGQTALSQSCFTFEYRSRWTRMADFPGSPRVYPIAHGLQGKLYFGLGNTELLGVPDNTTLLADLWEFDPELNQWTEKASFPDHGRVLTTSFVINSRIYVCFGQAGNNNYSEEVWEYSPEENQWTQKSSFSKKKRYGAFGFVIGDRAYIGGGLGIEDYAFEKFLDLWRYDYKSDSWDSIGKLPYNQYSEISILYGFSVNQFGYIIKPQYSPELRQYNPETNTWRIKAPMPGSTENIIGFSLNGYLYTGLGWFNEGTQEFYKYDPDKDIWTAIGFPGQKRFAAGGCESGGKGFICGGISDYGSEDLKADCIDLWMFDPSK
ncbi:MAG: IPT/TIG domain-containing protein [Bacteroidales bacterium]|nr:IPT/TIG domain-containing protein [Bacteroidales bacterium]